MKDRATLPERLVDINGRQVARIKRYRTAASALARWLG